jgi:hypothetical protein
MTPIKNYPNPPPPGLNGAVEAAGIPIRNEGGIYVVGTTGHTPTETEMAQANAAMAIAAAYDPTAHVKAEKAAELAEDRWRKETGGFMFRPVKADRPYRFISTREAMGPVMGAVLALQSGVFPSPTLWKTAEGVFVEITEADVVPLFKAFAAHVAAAFTEEATKRDAADKAPWEEVGDIKIEAVAAIKVGE